MKIFYKKNNGELQYRFGDDGGKEWEEEREMTDDENSQRLKGGIISDILETEIIFNFSHIKKKALEKRKTEAKVNIKKEADNIRNIVVGDSSIVERDGWGLKAVIAQKVVAGTATAEELYTVATEVSIRGKNETAIELATKQIERSKKFAMATVTIDGMTSFSMNAIDGCNTLDEIETAVQLLKTKSAELKKKLFI